MPVDCQSARAHLRYIHAISETPEPKKGLWQAQLPARSFAKRSFEIDKPFSKADLIRFLLALSQVIFLIQF
jgi:hypothetical protein